MVKFKFKPMIFQMMQVIGKYSGIMLDDTHLHLKQFLEVASQFNTFGIIDDIFMIRLFPYSLKGGAKNLLNSIQPYSIATQKDLVMKFLAKYFPPKKNINMRNEITLFGQGDDESMFDA